MTPQDVQVLRQIKARLSLRPPQADALDALARVLDTPPLDVRPLVHGVDGADALAAVQAVFPSVQDFERDFPSLCFSLATGVGKTRLMGAFVAYLTLTSRSRNFFVLAPNTTIYDKLIADFQPTGAKYVFRGIAEFASQPPLLVTGDTWDQGRGVRGADLFGGVVINLFNVSKIDKDKGRVRKLNEVIGDSYFGYLAGLPDLVLLMDEAHRYRASAGRTAVADLRPALGLELTATPKSVGARSADFRNVIVDYPLGQAMADGFVKEPVVATRVDFRPDGLSAEVLERIKLEDGIHCHEAVKAELATYAQASGLPLVHPFMLVVAQDTAHAGALRAVVEAEDFFSGRYRGRVIEVHSALRGEESEEATARLLAVEKDGVTDVVIHVNKLKEGWDVSNLFTIVPLRTSLQLPTSLVVTNGDADCEVVEARQASPDDHVAGRRIMIAGEIAAEHGDLKQVLGERPAPESRFRTDCVHAVERPDFAGCEDGIGRSIRFGAGRHGDEEDAPADDCDQGEEFHEPLSGLKPRVLRTASRFHDLVENLYLPAQRVPIELLDRARDIGNR